MRVCQMIPDLGVGGAERMLLNLATALDRTRYDVHVVSLYGAKGTSVEADLHAANVPVTFLGKRVGFDYRMFRALRAVVRDLKPDVVHTHRAVLQYAIPALLRSKASVVHTVHNVGPQEVPRVGRVAHRIAFAFGVVPVAIGDMVARSFRETYGYAPAAVIPNGIDTRAFASGAVTRQRWRIQEHLDQDAVIFVAVARMAPQKNLAALVTAFRSVATKEPSAVLCLAGDGPQRGELEARCAELDLRDRVRFLGRRADVADLLSASDVLVMSSKWEGNPLSVLEAMAAGLPVVSTAVGGVPEIVHDGVTGLLVDTGSIEGLAAAMLELMDPDRRRTLGAAGRERARSMFDQATMAGRYGALYDKITVRTDQRAS